MVVKVELFGGLFCVRGLLSTSTRGPAPSVDCDIDFVCWEEGMSRRQGEECPIILVYFSVIKLQGFSKVRHKYLYSYSFFVILTITLFPFTNSRIEIKRSKDI